MSTVDDLATLLDCSLQQLVYWARLAPAGTRYRTFELAKRSGGTRLIEAPTDVLLVLQRKLCTVLTAVYEPRAPVHGFVRDRSILSNAKMHTRRSWVLNLDLSNFFPSIHFGRVRGIFQAKPFGLPEPVARVIAQLCCNAGRLPQGAPTSPILTNIICSKMDGELRRFSKEHAAVYTRYADDITFSVRGGGFPQAIGTIQKTDADSYSITLSGALGEIFTQNGFALNDAKTRIQPRNRSQRVTGLIVNRKPNVHRKLVRKTRAMLHAWETYGIARAQAKYEGEYGGRKAKPNEQPPFQSKVRGCIAYIGWIRGRDDAIYLRFLSKYHVLIGQPLPGALNMNDNTTQRDVFICHASEDKKLIVEPFVAELTKANVSLWFDKSEIGWGDSITGKISEGLASSKYVVVIVSSAFLKKRWAQKELNAAMSKEISSGQTHVLPVVVAASESEFEEIQSALPLLADKNHVRWTGAEDLSEKLQRLLASQSSTSA